MGASHGEQECTVALLYPTLLKVCTTSDVPSCTALTLTHLYKKQEEPSFIDFFFFCGTTLNILCNVPRAKIYIYIYILYLCEYISLDIFKNVSITTCQHDVLIM